MNFSKRLNRGLCLTVCILLFTGIFVITMFTNQSDVDKSADAVTNYSNTTQIGSITLDNYATNSFGGVFDGDMMTKLYSTLLGKNNATINDIKNALTSGNLTSDDFRNNNPESTASQKKDIVVEIAGLKWVACYLSLNKAPASEPILTLWLANSSQLPTAYKSSVYNSDYLTNAKGLYPTNMYATSKLRAVGLNNGGKYATSNTTLTTNDVTQDKNNPFAIYTMPNSTTPGQEFSGSLIDFIDAPEKVEWQEFEQCKGLDTVTINYENDAYSDTITNFETSQRSDNMSNCGKYGDWKTDKIWIPSMAEMGFGTRCYGIWRRSAEMYNNASDYWVRSASYVNYTAGMKQTGADVNANNSMDVRPAFHLNLAKVEEKSTFTLSNPQYTYKTYDGDPQTVDKGQNWYRSSLFGAAGSGKPVVVEYYDEDNSIPVTTVKNADTYTVRFRIIDTVKARWADATSVSDVERTCEFEILKKPVAFTFSMQPPFVGATNSVPVATPNASNICTGDKAGDGSIPSDFFRLRYKNDTGTDDYDNITYPKKLGWYKASVEVLNANYTVDLANTTSSNEYRFQVTERRIQIPQFTSNGGNSQVYSKNIKTFRFDYDNEEIKIELPSEMVNKLELADDGYSVKVKNGEVGDYYLNLHLIDQTGSALWYDSANHNDRTLEFHVTKYEIVIDIVSVSGEIIDVDFGADKTVSIEFETKPLFDASGESDVIDIDILAYIGKETPTKLATLKGIDADSDDSIACVLNTKDLDSGIWTIIATTDAANYSVSLSENRKLSIVEAQVNQLNWRLFKDNTYQNKLVKAEVGETDVKFTEEILYTGKAYSFKINRAPSGYTIDTNNTDGFIKGYRTLDVETNTPILTEIKNAGKYKTQVRLLDTNNSNAVVICEIAWEITPVKFDMSKVKWLYDGQLPYDKVNGSKAELDSKTLPTGLIPHYATNTGTTVGTSGSASVTFTLADGYEGNCILPTESDTDSYIDPNGDFEWNKPWNIVKAKIQSTSWKNSMVTDINNHAFGVPVLRDPNADGGIVEYEYYETDSMGNILDPTKPLKETDIVWSESEAKFYVAKPILQDTVNYELDNVDAQSKVFRVGKDLTKVSVSLEKTQMEYNTNPRHAKLVVANGALPTTAFDLTYYDGYTKLSTAPTEVGNYRVEVSLKSNYIDKYQIEGDYEFDYEIVKGKIPVEWNDNAKPSVLKLSYGQINGVEYEIVDADDNAVAYNALVAGKPYRIRAKIKDNQLNNFEFADGTIETDWHEFSVTANDRLLDPNSPSNPAYPQTDPDLPTQDPTNPDETGSGNELGSGDEGGSGSLGDILEKLKDIPLWQLIASVISIILILIFISKGAGYLSKSKQNKRMAESKYKTYYAGAFLGLAISAWTAIACVLMVLAVLSLVFMIIAKGKYNKSLIYSEELRDEYERNKADVENRKRAEEKEDMKMMFMSMMGGGNMNGGMGQGMPQGAYMGGYGLGADEIRGIVSETMTAMLPGMQQLLPQQASTNDEVVQKLIEQNEMLMQKLAEQQPVERVVEKQVVATADADDETIKRILDSQEQFMERSQKQDETISKLMEKLIELSANNKGETQIIEKEVPVEKIVEKVVEVPVEKIVEKEVKVEVPVEVEKIVEKEVVKEVKVEVPVAVPTPSKPKKEVAPRLTLDEAYALLSKQQQKFFDGLRQYALSKPNSKEKKSTYFTVFGQSSVNPLMKLTIKKDTVVALFKMEDEYLKDIKRDATGDGTKIKVKETEVIISDAQACKAAKNMIDLREDQIERYQDLLKEQRALSKQRK